MSKENKKEELEIEKLKLEIELLELKVDIFDRISMSMHNDYPMIYDSDNFGAYN